MQNTVKRPRHRPVDEAKRAAILDCAREEFFAHGFAAASIETIAEASRVSKVTVYNRFGSKESLFKAVVERECQRMSAGLETLMTDHVDLRQQLIQFGEKVMGFLLQPHVIRFERRIASESEQRPEVGELFLDAGPRRMQQRLVALIEQAVANGALAPCNSRMAAGHLYGMIIGFDVFLSRFAEHDFEGAMLRSYVEQAVDRFLAAYSA
jgi:TetR/AcrR family transcriptional repressor of mexJK operon